MLRLVDCALSAVPAEHAAAVWPRVKLLLRTAFIGRAFDDDIGAIEADVLSGDSMLWIVLAREGILAAATTKIMQAPTRRVLRVECCAGAQMPRWIDCIRALEDYGRRNGCAVCRIEGRKGWKDMLPDYREPYVVLEKAL